MVLLGGLSQFSRVPEFRVEEEQAAPSDMSIDIDYLEYSLFSDVFTTSNSLVLPALRFVSLARFPLPVNNHE